MIDHISKFYEIKTMRMNVDSSSLIMVFIPG
jgi:hypothetical protein